MSGAAIRRLGRDRRGATLVEFAIVAPVMMLFLAGAFDMAHSLYMTATVQGIVQKTARDSSLQSSTDTTAQATIDNRIRAQVWALANNAQVAITRRFYRTFSDAAAAKAEVWTDTNNNGTCDNGEAYTDANNNGVWDADGGDSGQGGAKDRTVYTVTVTYTHLLPVWTMIGLPQTQTLVARTVLENQPYDEQGTYGTAVTRYCT